MNFKKRAASHLSKLPSENHVTELASKKRVCWHWPMPRFVSIFEYFAPWQAAVVFYVAENKPLGRAWTQATAKSFRHKIKWVTYSSSHEHWMEDSCRWGLSSKWTMFHFHDCKIKSMLIEIVLSISGEMSWSIRFTSLKLQQTCC